MNKTRFTLDEMDVILGKSMNGLTLELAGTLKDYISQLRTYFTDEEYSLKSDKGKEAERIFFDLEENSRQSILPREVHFVCENLLEMYLSKIGGLV
jgi:hypothetical protein